MSGARAARSLLNRLVLVSPLCISLCTALACERPELPAFPIELDVQSDTGQPIPGARLWIGGAAVGASNDNGQLLVALRGLDGDRLPLRLECPQGFTATPEEGLLILRRVQPLDGGQPRPLRQALSCTPSQRAAVVVVRVAGAAHVPVAVDGSMLAHTDAHGFAHVYVERAPGARLEVMLDTRASRELMPQNPRRTFELSDRDALFVFDQTFKKHTLRAAAPAAPPERRRPTRLH
jgi:hypothetical protein